MKKLYLLGLASVLFSGIWAQSYSPEAINVTFLAGMIGPEYQSKAKHYDVNQYYGSWNKGILYLKNDNVISGIFLRYDKFTDELLWLRETDFKTGVICHDDIRSFDLYGDNHMLQAHFENKKIKLSYRADSADVFLEQLVTGKFELYAYRKVKEGSNYALLDETYYIIFADGKPYFAGLKMRSLSKIPVMDEQKMKAVLKNGQSMLNGTEGGLINFIYAYNKL